MSSLQRAIASRLRTDASTSRPECLNPTVPGERERLHELLASNAVREVIDTLDDQLLELARVREPKLRKGSPELLKSIGALQGEHAPEDYGLWVFYPWSGALVHLLAQEDFIFLRSNRNQHKITAEEQATLRKATIGIVGLSVGNSIATTCAMEGIGGSFRLADMDSLGLSNLNRLRARAQDLGMPKTILAARQMFEIDPFLDIELFDQGVTDASADAFFRDGLSMLFDECDDLYAKVKLREWARQRRCPVVMCTDDRGLVDVERFDLEPERPSFHGLAGEFDAETLRGLSTADKAPYILRILGEQTCSPAMIASLMEIDESLVSFPQLASEATLADAQGADVARRVILGQFTGSGRFYVELGELIQDAPDTTSSEPESVSAAPTTRSLERNIVAPEHIHELVAAAQCAPSGGNCQPWSFEFESQLATLRCFHDLERSRSFLDYGHRATYLAFGAAMENLCIKADSLGVQAGLQTFPRANTPELVCQVALGSSATCKEHPLTPWIAQRSTNRRLGTREPAAPELLAALSESAAQRGRDLRWLTEPQVLQEAGDILGEGDRFRLLHPVMHQEMVHEIRWSPEEAQNTLDGIDVETLELSAADLAGLKLARSWKALQMLRRLGLGFALGDLSRKTVAASSALGLITGPGDSPHDWFESGRALQRVWLEANAGGLAMQPMTASLYVFMRLDHQGEGLDKLDQERFAALRDRLHELLPLRDGHHEAMMFRVAQVDPPTARALRRPVEDVLSVV